MAEMKLNELVGWRRSIAIWHIMKSAKNEYGMTKEAALQALGVTSKRAAARTYNTVEALVQDFGSLDALKAQFERLEPYANSAQQLWYSVLTLATNGVMDVSTFKGKFSDLNGIGPKCEEMLNNARKGILERLACRVDMHLRVPRSVRSWYRERAKELGMSANELAIDVLTSYMQE